MDLGFFFLVFLQNSKSFCPFVVSDTNGQKDLASSLHPNSNPKVCLRVEVKTLYRPVSMKLSKISLFVEALRVPFTVT